VHESLRRCFVLRMRRVARRWERRRKLKGAATPANCANGTPLCDSETAAGYNVRGPGDASCGIPAQIMAQYGAL
jgi:hypothetical protein